MNVTFTVVKSQSKPDSDRCPHLIVDLSLNNLHLFATGQSVVHPPAQPLALEL
jgi:hypothetical protein